MKKFFLIPLVAFFACATAWGETVQVGTFAKLQSALLSASAGDVIQLTANIAYETNGTGLINIDKSITLDGQGKYTISGYGRRDDLTGESTTKNRQSSVNDYDYVAIAINHNATASDLIVTLQNLTINAGSVTRTNGVMLYDGVSTLNITNCTIIANGSNSIPLALYGETTTAPTVNIESSYFNAGTGGYAIVYMKPVNANISNSTLQGYSAMSFKCPFALIPDNRWSDAFGTQSAGARGSVITVTSCDLNADNIHSGESNGFGGFNFEEDGITLNLVNCGMSAQKLGDASQALFLFNGWYVPKSRETENITINLSGDNTHINATYVNNLFYLCALNINNSINGHYGSENGWTYGGTEAVDADKYTSCEINITVSGGTYSINPETYEFDAHIDPNADTYALNPFEEDAINMTPKKITIADGYEVKEVKQGTTTVYRVVKKAAESAPGVLYDLNANVESKGDGQNPVTSFDLKTGGEMTLNQSSTKAGYVLIENSDASNPATATTVTVANNQTLTINNGLDIQGESKIQVAEGGTVVIGEGGINTKDAANIVLNASADAYSTLLLDPTITVNKNPIATYYFKSRSYRKDSKNIFQFFGMPTFDGNVKIEYNDPTSEVLTYITNWDYTADVWSEDWKAVPAATGLVLDDAVPFGCYELVSNNAQGTNMTYKFSGNLMGNSNADMTFNYGFNPYANSYTAPLDIQEFLERVYAEYAGQKIDAVIYAFEAAANSNYTWTTINLSDFEFGTPAISKIAPMQGFMMRLGASGSAAAEIDYQNDIYDPFMTAANPAPARNASTNNNYMEIAIATEGEAIDNVKVIEDDRFSRAFDNGYDAHKYLNQNFAIYAMEGSEAMAKVASDNVSGAYLGVKVAQSGVYTLNIKHNGLDYALVDLMNNNVITLTDGANYEFYQEAGNNAARFQIVPVAKVPTAIDAVENEVKSVKVLKDGVLYIIKDGVQYNAFGQAVK